MKKFLILFICACGMSFFSQAQNTVSKEYEVAMTKMLEVSNSLEAMKQIAPQITTMVKQQAPEAPQEFWDELEKNMENMYAQILKAMIPVYQKYLTLEDVQGIIQFYESPVGKKLAVSNTKIAIETMPIAQQIAMETMQKSMQLAKEKGYIK